MLQLRPGCECCDKDLPPESAEARICSFECTWCADCAATFPDHGCPNCGGNLYLRPIRPRHLQSHQNGSGRLHSDCLLLAARSA